MKEIGSEFWEVPVSNKKNSFFPENTQWFISGRGALQAILSSLKDARTAAVPSWACHSMVKPFMDMGIEVKFYPVFIDKTLVQEPRLDCDILFLMDYFGYTSHFSVSHPCIIRDVTHSIFSQHYGKANYYFGSLRKWCGIWTGGYAWGNKGEHFFVEQGNDSGYVMLRQQAMEEKSKYLEGVLQEKKHLRTYEKAEILLDKIGALPGSDRDINLMIWLDKEFIKRTRRNNAKKLMKAFYDYLIFKELNEEDVPLFVPIMVPDGERNCLRQYLIDRDIYCPVHWPFQGELNIDIRARELYDNELSLICDHRYTEEDMDRIIEAVGQFWRERKRDQGLHIG